MAPSPTTKTGKPLDKAKLDALLKARMFFAPAFDPYGGVAGLYDYGPALCQIQNNFLDIWRKHFVIEEGMLEVEPTILTPEIVLATSGHVAKFAVSLLPLLHPL
jgi:glycyl-tRNA synthetase